MSEDEPRVSHEAERLGPAPPVPAVATEDTGPLRRLLGHATIDLTPLRRRRDYRLLFAGQALSFFGAMLTYVAIPYQVYHLTGSSLAVGLLSLAALVPLLFTAFIGGALADAVDRRRMLQFAEGALGLATAILFFNSLLDEPKVWVLFVVTPLLAAIDGFQRPALDSMVPRLVSRDELTAAAALDSMRGEFGMIAGPAIGGILIATIGLPATYGIDIATYGASVVALALMRAVPPPPDAAPPSLGSIVEGMKYAWSRQELLGSYGVDMVAMFFGMPIALFPAIATQYGGAEVLGLLYAAPAVGALIASLTSGWASRVHRHGLAIMWAAASWGLAIAVFGLVTQPVGGVRLPRPRGRRGHDQRDLPRHALEPDDPRPAARPARRDRAGELFERSPAREPRIRRRRHAFRCARLGRVRRRPLHRRRRDLCRPAARVQALRLPRADNGQSPRRGLVTTHTHA